MVDAGKDILSADLQSSVIEYLRMIAAPQTPPDYRLRALRYLVSFSKIPRVVLEGLVPELVGYAESEGDINMRNETEESLLSLRTGNMPLERDLWEDFYRYPRTLIADPDLERQACKILGQARATQRHHQYITREEERLVARNIELATQYGRHGYRRITALLRQEGWQVSSFRSLSNSLSNCGD